VPRLLELRLATLHRAQRWNEAIATARDFLARFGDHERAIEVTYGLAVALARSGSHAEAREVFAELAAANGADAFPRQDELYYEWAWASRRDGDEAAALDAFEQVAATSNDAERRGEAQLHLGLAALEQGDAARGRQLLLEVTGRHRAQARYRAAFSWLEDGEPDRALPLLTEILGAGTAEPLYCEALFVAGECELELERYGAAAEHYAKLLEQAPEHERAPLARLHGGRALLHEQRAGEAAGLLEEYLQRGGGAPVERAEAQLTLGRAREQREELDRAEAAYAAVTHLSEGELAAEAQFRIGEVRRAKGDLDGAVDAFVKLAILYAHEDWVRRALLGAGTTYLQLEQPGKAEKFLRELIERFPESAEAGAAREQLDRMAGR
jgi:TolA-binding protein